MTVLVSGGTGFVGLNVAEVLLRRGERVVLYALDRPEPAVLAALSAVGGELIAETGDVRDGAAFGACLRRHGVDRLLPFAAVTSAAERERETPELVLEVNLMGFIAQLRAARDAGVRRVIAPASGAVYGESWFGDAAMDEVTTPCRPIGVYGVSKYAVDRTAQRLGALWGMDVIVARIGSVFGPWERDTGLRDMLTPFWQVADAAVRGAEAVLPAEIPAYSWVYARDLARGIVHLLDLPEPPVERVFNVCSGLGWGDALLEWCAMLAAAYPAFRWRQSDDASEVTIRLSETRPRTVMRIDRARATGWAPEFPPAAAFADYLAWVQAHTAGCGLGV